MSMERQGGRRLAAHLALSVGKDADAAQITDSIVSTWQEIAKALTPIIGQRGMTALYQRSLYLTAPAYPWLTAAHEGFHAALDLETLKATLLQQNSAELIACGEVLLEALYELLASLVGSSLTERLLRPVWTHSLSGHPAQDTTP